MRSVKQAHTPLSAWRRRQHLIFVGYSEAEILQLGDLAKLTNERMNSLMHSDNHETTEKTDGGLTGTSLSAKLLRVPLNPAS